MKENLMKGNGLRLDWSAEQDEMVIITGWGGLGY